MIQTIHTSKAPKAVGPYAQAILAKDTLYVSGQLPIDPLTGEMKNNIEEQTKQCLENLLAIVEESNMTKNAIVKCTVYLQNMSEFSSMNQAYEAFFGDHKPARVTIEVAKLPKNALVEIDCIAVK